MFDTKCKVCYTKNAKREQILLKEKVGKAMKYLIEKKHGKELVKKNLLIIIMITVLIKAIIVVFSWENSHFWHFMNGFQLAIILAFVGIQLNQRMNSRT